MGITTYEKEVKPGVFQKFYLVIAEGLNKYTGKRVQKKRRGIVSKPKAELIYKQLWSQCREERPDGSPVKTWGELLNRYFTYVESNIRSVENPNGFSPAVVATKKSRLKHIASWENTHLELIFPIHVTKELDKLEVEGKVGRTMTHEIQKEIKCVMSFAVSSGFLKNDPLANLKRRKVPKRQKSALTHEEVNKLLSEAKARKHPYFSIWLLSITTGLRRSELAGLKWTDIDLENGLLHVRRQMKPGEGLVPFPKNKEERTAPLPAFMCPVLKELKLASESEYVIDINCGTWNSGDQARVIREFCREIGIKEVTHHNLRATFITLALLDGVSPLIVRDAAGHSDLSITNEYARSSGINMRGQTDGLNVKVPPMGEGNVLPLRTVK